MKGLCVSITLCTITQGCKPMAHLQWDVLYKLLVYKLMRVIVAARVVKHVTDASIISEGLEGLKLFTRVLLRLMSALFVIRGASNHPWSNNFIVKWADLYGLSSIICVDIGTRNHIMQLAFVVSGLLMVIDDDIDENNHLDMAPRIIIIIGVIFIMVGIKVITDEIGLIQDIMAPAVVAIIASSDIGFIMLGSSLIWIWGVAFDVDHIVINLNRME